MRKILGLLSVLALSSACSHTVLIDSEPSGAEIKINGEKVGTAPVSYNEQTGWEKIYDLQVNKPGYKTARKQLKQTEWNYPVTGTVVGCSILLGTPASIIGALPLVGLLWSRQLPDHVIVTLDQGVDGAPATPPPGGSTSAPYGY